MLYLVQLVIFWTTLVLSVSSKDRKKSFYLQNELDNSEISSSHLPCIFPCSYMLENPNIIIPRSKNEVNNPASSNRRTYFNRKADKKKDLIKKAPWMPKKSLDSDFFIPISSPEFFEFPIIPKIPRLKKIMKKVPPYVKLPKLPRNGGSMAWAYSDDRNNININYNKGISRKSSPPLDYYSGKCLVDIPILLRLLKFSPNKWMSWDLNNDQSDIYIDNDSEFPQISNFFASKKLPETIIYPV